jgi:hypothetical protein
MSSLFACLLCRGRPGAVVDEVSDSASIASLARRRVDAWSEGPCAITLSHRVPCNAAAAAG